MDLSFGARLRLQRERQQVPLTAIAEQTKIKVSLLDGLERDDLSHWPGGIFRRSYVRAYAHAIGLEPETVVEEFLARYPDPVEDVRVALASRAEDAESDRRPPTRLGYLISSALSALPALRPQQARAGRDSDRLVEEPTVEPLETVPTAAVDDLLDAGATFLRLEAEAHDAPEEPEIPLQAAGPVESPSTEAPIEPERPLPDLPSVAALCTRLCLAGQVRDVTPVLADVARLLDAVGLILWTWEAGAGVLRPAISHGYADHLLAQLPRVGPESDNAIAWAFRSAAIRTVEGNRGTTGAIAAPLMTPGGCAGVLAIELRHGDEHHEGVRALAAILAAQLSTLVEAPEPLAQAVTA